MALYWRIGACSDIGRTRRRNDDSAYAGPHLLVVADGMGGAAAGDVASTVAVQTLQRLDETPPDDLLEALAGTLHRANDRLAELIEDDPSVAGMGTTVTAALFDGERIGVAHLGDSRGYLWRDGDLLPLTADHTWVQTLVEEGRLTEAEARVHSHRSLLLKVLDGQHHHDPDLALYDVQHGDRLLLCSDGLTGFVEPDRIARTLRKVTFDSAPRELTQLALSAGSNDNITVVVAEIFDGDPASTAPILVGAVAEPSLTPRSRLRGWPHRDSTPAGKSLLTDPDFDPEEMRYAPRPPRRFAALRRLAVVLVLAAVAVAGGLVAYHWSQQQYYVAAYGRQVAIYRGVQASLPAVTLHSVFQAEPLRLSELPSFRRSQVLEGMPADSLKQARRILVNLNSFARACAKLVTQTSVPTSPSPRPPTTPTTATAPTTSALNATSRSATSGQAHSSRQSPRRRPAVAKTTTRRPTVGKKTTPPRTPTTTGTTAAPTVTTHGPAAETAKECAGATPGPTHSSPAETTTP